MTIPKVRQRRPCTRDIRPKDPAVQRFSEWSSPNRGFYETFRQWLKDSGCGASTLNIYSVAVRQTIGFLRKPYWAIDLESDLNDALAHFYQIHESPGTREGYRKGLKKMAEFLHLRYQRPLKPPDVHWQYFTASLPACIQAAVRCYVEYRKHHWASDRKEAETAGSLLSHLTLSLRWMAAHGELHSLAEITPQAWFSYVDARLAAGISPKTCNKELATLRGMLEYLRENGEPVCERLLLVQPMQENRNLPRDVPVEQLRRLQAEIHKQALCKHAGWRRIGRMDLAWFLLMLHCGLRTGEVRRLKPADIDWEGHRLRIEQSKGLKDRLVYMTPAVEDTLKAYLEVRGPADALPEQVFIFRHKALSRFYCGQRLHTYGRCCGVSVTPHQTRHSCATLLLNAGASVLTVQNILGHKHIDTTLGYARLYDGTVASDYYRAMFVVEQRLALPEDRLTQPPAIAQLQAMTNTLETATLTREQAEVLHCLQAGLLAWEDWQLKAIHDVKVPT